MRAGTTPRSASLLRRAPSTSSPRTPATAAGSPKRSPPRRPPRPRRRRRAAMPKASHLSRLGVAKEVTPGTPVAATAWIPWKTLTPKDDVNLIEDTGQRGAPVDVFGLYAGQKGA